MSGFRLKGNGTSKKVKPVVLIVRTRDAQGRPAMLEALHEEQTVDLRNELNREFLIVFGEPDSWGPNPSRREGRA